MVLIDGPPSTELFAIGFSIVGVFITAVFAAPWLMRKVNRDLVKAQTTKTEAETDEIMDRQAGVWIGRYEQRFIELDEFLDELEDYLATHAAWDFKMMAACTRANIDFVEPPPLKPPKRARARRPPNVDKDPEHLDRKFLEGRY
jgi:hypothetical protein